MVLSRSTFQIFNCGDRLSSNREENEQIINIYKSSLPQDNSQSITRWIRVAREFNYYHEDGVEIYFSTNKSPDMFNTLNYKYIGDYQVNNKLYKDVKRFERIFNRDTTFVYFSKNVGIIQRKYADGNKQNLVKHKVIQ